MKKLWKKILKSPLNSSVDPRCAEVFDQMGAPSTRDMDKTETDFFNLDSVKPKILEFYKKSLCNDVYEKSTPEENATRLALIRGVVRLLIKVYTLEMCLASIISWDSFDMSDVFKDKLMIKTVIDNITKDLGVKTGAEDNEKADWGISYISTLATDIIKTEENLSIVELAKLRQKYSSIEYLIGKEAEQISSVIKNLFVNSAPLSTDLQLSTIKSSDADFTEEYNSTVQIGLNSGLAGQMNYRPETEPWNISELHTSGGFDYVVDARLKNNIYTMNYGDTLRTQYPESRLSTQASHGSDIFGFVSQRATKEQPIINPSDNKNYLHSIPLNYLEYFSSHYPTKNKKQANGAWSQYKRKTEPYSIMNAASGIKHENFDKDLKDIRKITDIQAKILGYCGAYGKEFIRESSYGNKLNAHLGNITFEPYIKIEDYSPNDPERDKYGVDIWSEIDSSGEPCAGANLIANINIADYLGTLGEVYSYRTPENNVFNAHIFGCVALPVWSHFYNNILMKKIISYKDPENDTVFPLRMLYQSYGLKPFFKKIKFGMRMVYSNSYIVSYPPQSLEGQQGPAAIDSLFFNFRTKAFGNEEASRGIKNIKCLFGDRAYRLHTNNNAPLNFIAEAPQDSSSHHLSAILPEI